MCRDQKKKGKRYFSWNMEITLDNTLPDSLFLLYLSFFSGLEFETRLSIVTLIIDNSKNGFILRNGYQISDFTRVSQSGFQTLACCSKRPDLNFGVQNEATHRWWTWPIIQVKKSNISGWEVIAVWDAASRRFLSKLPWKGEKKWLRLILAGPATRQNEGE